MPDEIVYEALDEFFAEGVLKEVVSIIKGGKEATAYLCRVDQSLGAELAVAKVYHDRDRRNFADDSAYEVGQRLLRGHAARAVANKSVAGRAIQSAMWVDHEFETLSALNYAGVDVPAPYVSTQNAILMEYIGDDGEPAPQLTGVRLSPTEAANLWERMQWNIETMLRENCIHADLSAFNVLYHQGVPVIIDLPQAVDPRFNRQAERLLHRDVRNMASYLSRTGFDVSWEPWARELWRRFELGEL